MAACNLRVDKNLENPSTREDQVNRLLPSKAGCESCHTAFLVELRTQCGWGTARPYSEPFNLLIDIFSRDREAFAPRDLVERQRARNRGARWIALRFAELSPVDSCLSWIDVLLHEPAGKLLDAPIHLAIDKRRWQIECHTLGQLLQHVGAQMLCGVFLRLLLQVGPHAIAKRAERFECADILRELVVEFGKYLATNVLHRHRVFDVGIGHFLDCIVVGEMDRESLRLACAESNELSVKAGRIGRRPELEAHVVVGIGCALWRAAVSILAFDIQHRGVAVLDAAVLDRLELRAALTQVLQRLLDGFIGDHARMTRRFDGRQITDVKRRNRFNRGRELEGLSLLEPDIFDVRRADPLDTWLLERRVDGARNEPVRHVVEDLFLEALLDQSGRYLPGAEAGDARLFRVALGDAVDFGVHDVDRDLDRDGLLRGADVSELCLHSGWALGFGLWARGSPEPKAQSLRCE